MAEPHSQTAKKKFDRTHKKDLSLPNLPEEVSTKIQGNQRPLKEKSLPMDFLALLGGDL